MWRTPRLLFMRPGGLSCEFATGRRRSYVNPFRLLIAIVAYALMSVSVPVRDPGVELATMIMIRLAALSDAASWK